MATMLALQGCANRPINDQLPQVNPAGGYRPSVLIPKRDHNEESTLFVLSFSGGGTRAAAFSYGVLEELRNTDVIVEGERRRLIDEVDLITGVSGGSFTALSYALYGDRLFSEYEERFLKRNVQRTLIWKSFNPLNWIKLMSGNYGRSELAAEYYDKILFNNATYADLIKGDGPVAIVTGTEMSFGSRFAFFQNDFDLICSKLDTLNLSRAAATSSAVPVVLSPVTLNNYSGSCNYQYPPWVNELLEYGEHERPSGRALERYKDMAAFRDSEERPYLHLVDGGVSDNIGVRGVLDTLEEFFISRKFAEERGFPKVKKLVIIVVNARSSENNNWGKKESPPGMTQQLLQSSGVPIERYSFETVELMKDRAAVTKWRRDLLVARAQLGGMTEAEAEASIPKVDVHVMEVSFARVKDPQQRERFQSLPTSFALPAEDVDGLRDIAGELMRQSPEYEKLLRSYGTQADGT